MDKCLLEKYISKGMSQRKIAIEVGKSQGCIKYWLKKYGLKTLTNNRPRPYCSACKETDTAKFYTRQRGGWHSRCITCYNREQVEKFRRYKKELVDWMGGKCILCGYCTTPACLEFHHLDPSTKDPDWNKMSNWSPNKRKDELEKCILVCRNCHGEIHAGLHPDFLVD